MRPRWAGVPASPVSVGLAYGAARPRALSPSETKSVEEILDRYDLAAYTDQGGEGFTFDTFGGPGEQGMIDFSVRLPTATEEAAVAALRYWLALLTALRVLLADAQWPAHMDDWDVRWSVQDSCYYLPD